MNSYKQLSICICFLLSLFSCKKEYTSDITHLKIHKELPVYLKIYDGNEALVNIKEIHTDVDVIRSLDELNKRYSKEFLDAYPEYSKVDFSKHTLLVKTHISIYKTEKHNIKFTYQERKSHSHKYNIYIHYKSTEMLSDNNFFIERIGIVVDNFNDTEVGVIFSVSS